MRESFPMAFGKILFEVVITVKTPLGCRRGGKACPIENYPIDWTKAAVAVTVPALSGTT